MSFIRFYYSQFSIGRFKVQVIFWGTGFSTSINIVVSLTCTEVKKSAIPPHLAHLTKTVSFSSVLDIQLSTFFRLVLKLGRINVSKVIPYEPAIKILLSQIVN
jgi:hypothetical protein